jgi:hypothetical protein
MVSWRIGAGLLPLLLGSAAVARAADPAVQNAADVVQGADAATVQTAPSDNAAASTTEQVEPAAKKKWEFATIGYIWIAGAWGKTDVTGPTPPVDLALPFGDVLKAFKFAFMGAAEAKHDRIIVLGDLMFIHLDAHKGIGVRDPDFLKAELDSRTAEITLLGGYRVVNSGPVTLDLLAGGRMNWFKTSLQLQGPNRELSGEVKKSWFDPLLAARVGAPLGGKWSIGAYGDVGGFGIGSHVTWQLVPTVNYQISHKMTLGVGWRYFKVNYSTGDTFLYNVHQSGPLIVFRTAM